MRRAANGTEVKNIDNLRDARESIFNFIRSIAVLNELDAAKVVNLCTITEGYRSRASSGAMDREKEEIIGSAMNYIKKNFGLK